VKNINVDGMVSFVFFFSDQIKDVTQKVLGALANRDQMTFKQVHEKYNLPLSS
jgi:Swi5